MLGPWRDGTRLVQPVFFRDQDSLVQLDVEPGVGVFLLGFLHVRNSRSASK